MRCNLFLPYVISMEKGDICQLTGKVHELESMIKYMAQQIEHLTIELEVVKSKKDIDFNDISSEKICTERPHISKA